jgi:hypothetical protein
MGSTALQRMSTAVDSTGGQAFSGPQDAARHALSRMRPLVVSGFRPMMTVIQFMAQGRSAAMHPWESLKF